MNTRFARRLISASALAVFLTSTTGYVSATAAPTPVVKTSAPEGPGTGTVLGTAPVPSEAPALIPPAAPICPCGAAASIGSPGERLFRLLAPFLHVTSMPESPGTGQAAGVPGGPQAAGVPGGPSGPASEAPVPYLLPPCPCVLPRLH